MERILANSTISHFGKNVTLELFFRDGQNIIRRKAGEELAYLGDEQDPFHGFESYLAETIERGHYVSEFKGQFAEHDVVKHTGSRTCDCLRCLALGIPRQEISQKVKDAHADIHAYLKNKYGPAGI